MSSLFAVAAREARTAETFAQQLTHPEIKYLVFVLLIIYASLVPVMKGEWTPALQFPHRCGWSMHAMFGSHCILGIHR